MLYITFRCQSSHRGQSISYTTPRLIENSFTEVLSWFSMADIDRRYFERFLWVCCSLSSKLDRLHPVLLRRLHTSNSATKYCQPKLVTQRLIYLKCETRHVGVKAARARSFLIPVWGKMQLFIIFTSIFLSDMFTFRNFLIGAVLSGHVRTNPRVLEELTSLSARRPFFNSWTCWPLHWIDIQTSEVLAFLWQGLHSMKKKCIILFVSDNN